LTKELHRALTHEERAVIRTNIQAIRRLMKDASFNIFVSEDVQVIVATSFKAMTQGDCATIGNLSCSWQDDHVMLSSLACGVVMGVTEGLPCRG
jgi:hypothetical protein